MKFKYGIRVQFNKDRLGEYDPFNTKYQSGTKGFVVGHNKEDNTYTIQVGQTNIINVPEVDLFNPSDSIQTKIEEHLRKKQEKKTFKDTEGRIGGSRKEMAAYKTINTSQLAEIEKDGALAIELIKKDRVFPKVDIGVEREKGTSSGATYLKVKLRENYPGSPPDNKEKRKIYVAMAEFLTKAMAEVVDVKGFEAMLESMKKTGLSFFIGVLLGPEVYEKIKAEREHQARVVEGIENDLQALKDKEREMLVSIQNDLYPQAWNEGRTYFEWHNVPQEIKQPYFDIQDKIRNDGGLLRRINKDFTSLEETFLTSMFDEGYSRYATRSSVIATLFKEIFGARFFNFVYKGSDAVKEVFKQAIQYDPLSVAESLEKTAHHSKWIRENLKRKEDKVTEAKALSGSQAYKDFFANNGSYGFAGGEFRQWGNKHFYGPDLKTPEQYQAYRKRFIEAEERNIAKYQEDIALIEKTYRARENDWSWAFPESGGGPTKDERKQGAEIKINTYPPLSHITRKGGILVSEEDVTVDSIREKFGFKEIEFGQSLKDTEAKEHVRHFLAAMADLADILNWDIVHLNKLGGLSIAFASRGSGKASAHYEPLRRVINITKTRGGGALAHEYMHYLDNILPSIDNVNYRYTNWASVKDTGSEWSMATPDVKNESVARATQAIFRFIYLRRTQYIKNEQGVFERSDKPFDMSAKVIVYRNVEGGDDKRTYNPGIVADTIEDYWSQVQKRYNRYRFIENMKRGDWGFAAWVVRKFGYKEYKLPFESRTSQYHANALNMSSDYWSRPWELLARSFETYIFDKLKKAGRENNYLVSGAYFERPEGVYPLGDEREILFMLFEDLMQAIKTGYNLADFNPWTKERVDENIVLVEEGKKEISEGVITDDKTGKVVATEGNAEERRHKAQKKLIKLYKLLKEKPSMERGGLVERAGNELHKFLLTLTD